MAVALRIDTTGGADFEGYNLRNVGSLHVGGGPLADPALGVLQITGGSYISGNQRRPNNTYSQSRNAAGTAWVDEWKINASNQLETNTPVVIGSTLRIGNVASDTTLTNGGLHRNTVDGADTASMVIGGGGDTGITRGAIVGMWGNEHPSRPGYLRLEAGNVAGGGVIEFYTQNLKRGSITYAGGWEMASTLSVTGVATFAGSQIAFSASGANLINATSPTGQLVLRTNGVDRATLNEAGVLSIGTTVTTGADAGEIVIGASKEIRAVNDAGTGTVSLLYGGGGNVHLGANATGVVHVGYGSAGVVLGQTATGPVQVGAPASVTGAVAGDVVLGHDRAIRGVNAAGTGTKEMIRIGPDNMVYLTGNDAGDLVRLPNQSFGFFKAAAAALSGGIAIDTTNNRLIYYSNGNRYALTGVIV